MEKLINAGLRSATPALIGLFALLFGAIALVLTPREEEPQIVVPVVDLLIEAPGLSTRQVERQVTTPVEKLLAQIPGVEHVYSSTRAGSATVTLRFHVGEDREDSLLNTYNKLYSNQDRIPPGVSNWIVKPVEVDDVPIVMLALWSKDPSRYDDFALRRMADEISTALQAIPQTNRVEVTGGRPRVIRLLLDAEALAARMTTPLDVVAALSRSNLLQRTGTLVSRDQVELVETGTFILDADELATLPVNVIDGVPVLLGEVAEIRDGPDLPENYTWIDFAPGHKSGKPAPQKSPMVTISVAKQPGTNAVWVAGDVHARIQQLKAELLPPEIEIEVLRDYGETANEKVNNLASSLGIAIITVVVFIGIFLGPRPAIVVGLAMPVCYGITLALDMLFGYTINRVTLFALILSLGLLVDDPITGVDNIERYLREKTGETSQRVVAAMMEIRTALIMSTLTIVLSFIPLAFITGMMGPYMAPMAFNVPVSVIMSTVVAFLVTPWLASRLIRPAPGNSDGTREGIYTRMVRPIISSPARARGVLWIVLALFIGASLLPVLRLVPLKLLPFDNKNEVQIVLDMPEGTTLEATAAKAAEIGAVLRTMPEVRALAYYIGTPSPVDFNGMIRQYYQRQAPHLADIRVTLADKTNRTHQSHGIVLRMRELLSDLAQPDTHIRVVEVPPGPPVISTLAAEVYADDRTSYERQREGARRLAARLAQEPFVNDVDTSIELTQPGVRFVTDKQKAALSGISTADIVTTVSAANAGVVAGYLNQPRETNPLAVLIRLPEDKRTTTDDLLGLYVRGQPGIARTNQRLGLDAAPQPLVALGELGAFADFSSDLPIYHKDLRPVVYVMAELSGRTPADVIADVVADRDNTVETSDWAGRTFLTPGGTATWSMPPGTDVSWTGEGEWRITVRVFRDMGIAFAFALVAIFIVLRIQTNSAVVALIIMSAIPLTFIGIMPGFWLLNLVGEREIAGAPDPVLFTATAMIGMIALAGIVVRNSLILVEFIKQAQAQGANLRDAILAAGEVRMRPILLTAGTTLLGNFIITLDPVFSGLALAIIFGIFSSTLFTLLVVPAVYYLIFRDRDGATPI
ncbi:MAG: efflux RND transporter permease subunit [Pseudomonadota bacterium]